MPVPISVTGFKNLAGDQNVHAEIAETASAGDWFSKMRGGGDVEKTSTTATLLGCMPEVVENRGMYG